MYIYIYIYIHKHIPYDTFPYPRKSDTSHHYTRICLYMNSYMHQYEYALIHIYIHSLYINTYLPYDNSPYFRKSDRSHHDTRTQ
jgi:hypothetical protein